MTTVFFFDELLDAGAACARAAREFPSVWFRIEHASPVMVVQLPSECEAT